MPTIQKNPMNALLDGTTAQDPCCPPAAHDARAAQIPKLLQAGDCEPWRIIQLITVQMAILSSELMRLRNDPGVSDRSRLAGHIAAREALRNLRRSIVDTELRRPEEDTLNIDGEQAQLLMKHLGAWFREALQAAGWPEEMRDKVWSRYRDLATIAEPALREEIEMINSKSRRR